MLKSQLCTYPCPSNISFMFNYGLLLNMSIITQNITGILLACHYVPLMDYSFLIIKHIIRDIYHGSLLRYLHSNGASFVFIVLYVHIYRAIYVQSYHYLFHTHITGIFIYLLLIIIAFLGYILPWGQMSYWGATVITNLLSIIPDVVQWLCGSFFVYNPTLNRFLVIHFILPFIVLAILVFHVLYLHLIGSTDVLSCNTNNRISFFTYIVYKDIFGYLVMLLLYLIQLGYGVLSISHPDNALQVNIIITPFHIVPEWYFLSFYAVLKAIPHKQSGISILLILIVAFLLTESFSLFSSHVNTGVTIYSLLFLVFMWIGTELPTYNVLLLLRFSLIWYFFISIFSSQHIFIILSYAHPYLFFWLCQ